MLEDLTKDIKAQFYDRARSPLFGAFAFSWASWNFKAVIIFFSGATLDDKFSHLEGLYPTGTESFTTGFIYPAFTAILFILLYPFAAKWAYKYWHKQHIQIKKIQQEIEDETPMPQKDANKLIKTSLDQQITLQAQIRSLSEANNEFTNREKVLIEKLEQNKLEQKKLNDSLEEKENEISKLNTQNHSLSIQQKKSMTRPPVENESSNLSGQHFQSLISSGKLEESEENIKLIDHLNNYFKDRGISPELQQILFLLTLSSGELPEHDVLNSFKPVFSKIEITHFIDSLTKMGLITTNHLGHIILTKQGNSSAVESGLTKLVKKLQKKGGSVS